MGTRGSNGSMSTPLTPRPSANLPADLHKPSSQSAPDHSSSSQHASYQASHPHWSHLLFPSHWKHLPLLSSGAGPFTTKLVHQTPSGRRIHWESRKHRKRLTQHTEAQHNHPTTQPPLPPWYSRWFPFKPDNVAWWTAVLFDVGSLCFVFSSICLFIPGVYNREQLDIGAVGWVSFAGSMFFTVGAFFQLGEVISTPIIAKWHEMSKGECQYMKLRAYKGRPQQKEQPTQQQPQQQQANGSNDSKHADDHPSPSRANLSSLLYRLDFHVAWVQWIGAMAFSINTFAFSGSFILTTSQTVGLVDFCDIFASCCFTISGYLSILEVTHTLIPFKSLPITNSIQSIDWWLTWFNFLGGVGFLLNGIYIVNYPNPGQLQPAYPLLIGSVFFQIGSHLQYLEQADTHNTNRADEEQAEQPGQQPSNELQKVGGNGVARDRQPAENGQTVQDELERDAGGRTGEYGQAGVNGHDVDGVH